MSPAPSAIPVVVTKASVADVPIVLDGIGAVQAFNTVTVKVQVDGQLSEVAFTEGQDVKRGDVLARIDPRPFQAQLDQMRAQKARDAAMLENARIMLRRYAFLAPRNDVARSTYDTQWASVAQLAAAVQADQAQIDYASIQLGFTTIASPLDGRTGVRLVDAGNIVHATDTGGLVVVTQLQPISVVFTLPEESLHPIQTAMRADPLQVEAYRRGETKPSDVGALLLVNNEINPATGTITLKATFPNADRALWPGEFVNTRLILSVRRGAVTVPAAAVQRGPNGTYAYVVRPDNTVVTRLLAIAQTDRDVALVDQGLSPGETVVVAGQSRLQDGAKVTQQAADSSKLAGASSR